jgi:hypothetical protein
VYCQEKIVDQRLFRQLFQPRLVAVGEVAFGPQESVLGKRIKIFDAADAGHGVIVVSSQAKKAAVAAEFRALVGIGIITDNVAQTDNLLNILPINIVQYYLEGLQIGVNITDYCIAHPVTGSLPDLPESPGHPSIFGEMPTFVNLKVGFMQLYS